MKQKEKLKLIMSALGVVGFIIVISIGLINIFGIDFIPKNIQNISVDFGVALILLSLIVEKPILGLPISFLAIMMIFNTTEKTNQYTEKTVFSTSYAFQDLKEIPENHPDAKCSIHIDRKYQKDINKLTEKNELEYPLKGNKTFYVTEKCAEFIKKISLQEQKFVQEIENKKALNINLN